MVNLGKPQKSRKHKKLKPIDPKYLDEDRKSKNRHIRKFVSPDEKLESKKKHGRGYMQINSAPKSLEDQEVSKSMMNLIKLKADPFAFKKKKQKNKFKDGVANEKLEKGMTRPIEPVPEFVQRKGENDHQFHNRIDRTVQMVISKSKFDDKFNRVEEKVLDPKVEKKIKKKQKKRLERKQEKNELKKEKLKEVKEYRKDKKRTGWENLHDKVEFGEVAMAPPTLTAKPRKISKKSDRPGNKDLLLKKQLADTQTKTFLKQREIGKTLKRKTLPVGMQRKQDIERENAIRQYRELQKAKRNH
ncbi:unnamed protein product [Owenia fusiformis]|uniref:Uncharacterized protein n=1 Tax=Owenia fusiformis TaxID=6347 RepID=A0A8J1Y0L6_OWEFU|nr:unnamed protein product [Owenia fusiformis]